MQAYKVGSWAWNWWVIIRVAQPPGYTALVSLTSSESDYWKMHNLLLESFFPQAR